MLPERGFIRFAAICCFISVITTLGIHAYFPDPPADFEQRILLFRNKTYLLNRWWVIIHCLLVIVSMWGFALLQMKRRPGTTGLGFLFFCVFAIAEITRQMIVLFYTNGLRQQYYTTIDPEIKQDLKIQLMNSGMLGAPLFGLFILMFALGCLCYGLSLVRSRGFSWLIAILLLIAAIVNFMAFANHFWNIDVFNQFIEPYNYTITPTLRALIGIWLWKKSNELQEQRTVARLYAG